MIPLPHFYMAFGIFCNSIILLAYCQNIISCGYGASLRSLCLVRIFPFFSTRHYIGCKTPFLILWSHCTSAIPGWYRNPGKCLYLPFFGLQVRAGIVIGSDFFCAFPFPITKLLQSGAEASMISKSTFFGSSEKASMNSYFILKSYLAFTYDD